MPSEKTTAALRDILHHIDLALLFISETDEASFAEDLRTLYAVRRCLEIIFEASRCLPDDLKDRHPSVAWRQMAGAGNVYRHEDVAARFVWETVSRDLLPLKTVIAQELSRLV